MNVTGTTVISGFLDGVFTSVEGIVSIPVAGSSVSPTFAGGISRPDISVELLAAAGGEGKRKMSVVVIASLPDTCIKISFREYLLRILDFYSMFVTGKLYLL
jgi:hypothetical protein